MYEESEEYIEYTTERLEEFKVDYMNRSADALAQQEEDLADRLETLNEAKTYAREARIELT